MEKKEFLAFIKGKAKEMGFKSNRQYNYLLVDDDYMIGFYPDGSTYGKMYQIVCGVIYFPTEIQVKKFDGYLDLCASFHFPEVPGGPLDLFNIKPYTAGLTVYLEYEKYTREMLEEVYEANYKRFFERYFDKTYGLSVLKKEKRLMSYFSPEKLSKICSLMGLNLDEVTAFLQTPIRRNLRDFF